MKAKMRHKMRKPKQKTLRVVPIRKALLAAIRKRTVPASDLSEIGLNSDALGIHLLIEMRGCLSSRLDDIEWVRQAMIEAAKRAKATIVETVFHKFNPIGISGVVVISESHLAIHIWPEHRYAAIDIFSCGTTLKGAEAAQFLIKQFRSARPLVVEMQRGLISPRANQKMRVLGTV